MGGEQKNINKEENQKNKRMEKMRGCRVGIG